MSPLTAAKGAAAPHDLDPRSGSIVERAIFNNRLVVVLLCALLTAFFAIQLRHLQLSASFEKMIPQGHPYIRNFAAHQKDLVGLGNAVRVAIANPRGTIYDAKYLEALRGLSDEIFLLPGVNRMQMKSLWTPSTRWAGVTKDGLEGGPVIPEGYDGSAQSLERLAANLMRSGEIGRSVATDFTSSVIYVPLLAADADGQPLNYGALAEALEKLRAKYEARGYDVHITGFAKLVGDLIDGVRVVLVFFAVTICLGAAVLYWFTRCWRSAAAVVIASLVAVVWQLGMLPMLGYALDPYSILVPFLVFAIGMSHGSQKMNGILQDVGRGSGKLMAARLTFRRLFGAGMAALVIDAVGFGVLLVFDIEVIRELALAASIGVAVLIFTNLLLLPILLSYTGVSAEAAKRSLKAELAEVSDGGHTKHPFWAFLDLFTQRKWAAIAIAIASVMGAIGLAISFQLKIGDTDQGAPELRPDSRYNRDNAFMVANYAASSDVYIVMVKTPQFHCAHYDTVTAVDALERELQQLPGVEATSSLAGLSKLAAAGLNEGSLKWYEIPRSQDMLNSIITRAPRELFNQNCDLLTVYAYLKDHKADTLQSVVKTVEAFAAEHNTEDIRFLSAAGNAGIEAATNIVVREANRTMLLFVYLAVTVFCLFTFRSWRATLVALLPLMLTSILCEALMVAMGIGVKVATLPVIALGVGIGVDYALYLLSVQLHYQRQGMSLSDAYENAVAFTGRVVGLVGITLAVGVITWAWSPIKFQADMGILLTFMFIWNMLGALILIPALSYFLLPSAAGAVPVAAGKAAAATAVKSTSAPTQIHPQIHPQVDARGEVGLLKNRH